MSNFDLIAADVAQEPFVVTCWSCAKTFNALASRWCSCDVKLRTLECPHCNTCFCKAPVPFKQKFWSTAPPSLRENPNRFRVVPTAEAAPKPAEQMSYVIQPRRPHVLVVDDEEPVRSLAACYVEQIGYEVTTASTPDEALLIVDAMGIDVVLTDALMPKMDGRELCRRLKQTHGSRIKVIVMTSLYTARRFQIEARHLFKVDEYLAKPFQYEELRAALHRLAPLSLSAVEREVMADSGTIA